MTKLKKIVNFKIAKYGISEFRNLNALPENDKEKI
jgi:hypothetical protein